MQIFNIKASPIFVFVLSLIFIHNVFAAQVSISVDVAGVSILPGSIISLKNGHFLPSFTEYDDTVYGVTVSDPALSLEDLSLTKFYYVDTSGEVDVRVSGINGPIKEGDFITTSRIPGVGQRADVSGYVLGVALANFEPQQSSEIGVIPVYLNISSVILEDTLNNNLVELFRNGFKVPFLTPLTSLRYILAALVSVIAFFIGFTSFGRLSSNSIEALGRNPLASKIIKSAILLNFVFTLGVVAIGLTISYLILTM